MAPLICGLAFDAIDASIRGWSEKHSTLMTVLTSALIFYGGYLDFAKKKVRSGKSWCIWAILILIFYSTTVIYSGEWWGLGLVLAALLAEVSLFFKLYLEAEDSP